jgi:hypothetical protein
MSKTIEIKKVHLRNILLSFILGFGILFCLEHFGKFSFIMERASTTNISLKPSFYAYTSDDALVSSIYYDSFFKNKVSTGGNGFLQDDLRYSDGDFYLYENKLFYIIEAWKLDFKYGFLISIFLFVLFVFFNNYKIKFS